MVLLGTELKGHPDDRFETREGRIASTRDSGGRVRCGSRRPGTESARTRYNRLPSIESEHRRQMIPGADHGR